MSLRPSKTLGKGKTNFTLLKEASTKRVKSPTFNLKNLKFTMMSRGLTGIREHKAKNLSIDRFL